MRAATLVLCLSFPAQQSLGRDWYELHEARAPRGDRVYICRGYGCRIVTPVQLSGADLARIAAPLKAGRKDAEAERQALSRSVQVFEDIIGKRIGTSGDRPGTQFGQPRADQMDCIDEATNTTSLFKVLVAHDLLAHHEVREPVARGFFLDGRYPHATAVLRESAGERDWAVDSWPDANAEPPLVQPLSEWLKGRRSSPT